MKPSINIRIYLKSYTKIKKVFPAIRGETMGNYFERLAEYLKESEGGNEDDNAKRNL